MRILAEQKIGRKLKPKEIVHHINRNTLDNDPQNLKVMLISDHVSLHRKEAS